MDWGKWFSRWSYTVNKSIRFKSPMLRSDLCDYSDTYVVVKGVKAVEDTINTKKKKKNIRL